MKIAGMNWMQVEQYLKQDDRCVIPLGSTEQHAYLSLSVDSILSEKVALDAAEPLGIPVFPVVSYGLAPHWQVYPGTVTLRITTYLNLVSDILDSVGRVGFKRILIVNGHGGNTPAAGLASEWMASHPGSKIKFHNWWNAPKTWEKVQEIDTEGSHASWMENFPWTRLADVAVPDTRKSMLDMGKLRMLDPNAIREYVGDGNLGGLYQRADEQMQALWDVAVQETRSLLTEGWD